jgi:small-conductance mechanosensitive channel
MNADSDSPTERVPFDSNLEDPQRSARKAIRYAIYAVALLFIIENFDINFSFTVLEGELQRTFYLSQILYAVFLLLLARVLVWVFTQLIMYGYYENRGVAKGSRFAINQLIKYIVYVVVVLIALQSLGFNLSLVLGGMAALLVGIGLGLQTTFNDLTSGIIILFERSIEVGHVVEMNGMVGVIQRIGLRASLLETRENIIVIVPNSKLVHENVINWSQVDNKALFKVNVGVAYGSNTVLVKKLLLDAVKTNDYVLDYPQPFVRFINFGDSSLEFEVLFWSKHFIIVENIKSDIRFEVDKLFRANNVRIPFPQRDVHLYPTPGGQSPTKSE